MQFTILIVSYNPEWKKLLVTLESVLQQDFKNYEIVITDDGSDDNCFPEIEHFFEERGFTDYTLVPHEKNQGTVKNIIDGLRHSRGKYVRDFGPGDAFYDRHTLRGVYDFFEENQCEVCFGLMRGYCLAQDGAISPTDFFHPFDIEAYRRRDSARILKNLVMYRDNASGACTCYRREFYLKYLCRLEGVVVYAEDIFQVLAGLDGHFMYFFPDYLVWYEADTGVSTRKKSRFSELLAQDVDRFYAMIHREYADHPVVKKQKRVSGFYRIRNLYLRSFLRMFANSDSIRYIINHRRQCRTGAYAPSETGTGFLQEETFQKLIQGECRDGDY